MRHLELRTLGVAAVAAAAFAISGAAWAQQAPKASPQGSTVKESSSSASTGNCVRTKGGDCVRLKSGSELEVKGASSKAK
jgi:hypothetical protein